jgi:hypothetical protein
VLTLYILPETVLINRPVHSCFRTRKSFPIFLFLYFYPNCLWCLPVCCDTWYDKRSSFVSARSSGMNSCSVRYVSHSNFSFVIFGIFLAAQCFNSHTFLELIYLNLSVASPVLPYLLLVQCVTLHLTPVYNPRQPHRTPWSRCRLGFKYLNSIIFPTISIS